ncbi:MAG: hypothetical protein O9318_01835 [Hylemonella sp.]|uniref:hypothetical protein n=1 Tax=Hylemonella sp. TaxID=2066020 RepID=UPI0022CC85F0|nr:hypothetical protein [Hylemonella sp.]MCZ8251188.1 hypothetical protein [Hylemonella sp.]
MKEVSSGVVVESRMEHRAVPKHWGESELTKFLAHLERQILGSFAGLPEWFGILIRIDQSVTEKAPTFFHEIDPLRRTSVRLFMRCFATYRAAVRLSVSGQLFEATVLMRSLLESAVYAWVCSASDKHRKAWEERGDGDAERKMSRKLFSWVDLLKLLEGANKVLAERISVEYEQLIDYGAHPNVDGLALSSDVRQLDHDKYEIITVFAHGREAVLLAILDLLRCMHYVCQLLFMVIKERLQILGLDTEFLKTSELIHELIGKLEAEQRMKVA